MAETLRVGIVGTGYIAEWHAKALAAMADVALCAVCDRDLARAQAFAARTGCKTFFGQLPAMLHEGKLHAVHVLTPPDSHLDLARAVLESGVSVLLEKPMGPDASECGKLVELARQRGLALGVSHNFLFAEPYQRLRTDVKSGRLGPLDTVDVVWHRELPAATHGPFNAWYLSDPTAILLEIGAHSIAAMLDLVGDPENIAVHAGRPIRLPTGVDFYRHWHFRASHAGAAINLNFSFTPAFDQHLVQVRGGFGVATANLADNTYVLELATGRSVDFDRYHRIRAVASSLRKQATTTLLHYLGSKCGLSSKGNPFGTSILGSVREFYQQLRAKETLDDAERIGGRFAQRVIATAQTLVAAARSLGISAPPSKPSPSPAIAQTQPAILVLGGAGFIGKRLVRQLRQAGHNVRLLVRNPQNVFPEGDAIRVELVPGDVRNPGDVEKALRGVETVFHLARTECKTLQEYIANDVEPTRQLAELCLQQKIRRFVYAGTIDSLYLGPGAGTVTESTPLDPRIARRNNYARAKAMAESLLGAMARDKGLPLTVMRPAIVIGAGGPLCHWGVGMWAGLGMCQFWGDGDHPIPLVLVDDVAKAMASAVDARGIDGKAYNLSSPPLLSARQYIAEIERHTGFTIRSQSVPSWKWFAADIAKWLVKVAVRHPTRGPIPSLYDWRCREQWAVFDPAAAQRDLGWTPCVSKEELVRQGIHEPIEAMFR